MPGLCLNPYAETVVEADGQRRVWTAAGWLGEDAVAPTRVCRASTAADVEVAIAGMLDPAVSASHAHDLERAYRVWRTPRGAATPTAVSAPAPGLDHFRRAVERAYAIAVNRAWVAGASQASLPRWDLARRVVSDSSVRAVQWGLANRMRLLPRQLRRQAHLIEAGLVSASDAASAHWPAAHRTILAVDAGDPFSSHSFVCAARGFPPPSPAQVHVLWTDAASVAWLDGGLQRWLAAFASGAAGWVISRDRAGALLARDAASARRDWTIWQINDNQVPVAWVCEVGLPDAAATPRVMELSQWAPPPHQEPRKGLADMREGLVPCTVLDTPADAQADAWAPPPLARAMAAARADLESVNGASAPWVASRLGVSAPVMGDSLTPEQVAAVAAALAALDAGGAFILADETGFGKGRVLAALATIALRERRPAVLVTENATLFSDFYRDLSAMGSSAPPVPTLLHAQGTVLAQDGALVVPARGAQGLADLVENETWWLNHPLLLTTYAMLSRKAAARRRAWLAAGLHAGAWLLLDESHNAAGDSQAAESIEKLAADAVGVVFASATFARSEDNLAVYRRASGLPAPAWRRVCHALAADQPVLRASLAQGLARSGSLVRRLHPPPPPPHIIWLKDAAIADACLAFSGFWKNLFEVVSLCRQVERVNPQGAWLELGALLARASREFSMLAALPALVDRIREHVAAGRKPVVATEMTLESALREHAQGVLPCQDEAADEAVDEAPLRLPASLGKMPLWRDRWVALLERLAPHGCWQEAPPELAMQLRESWHAAAAAAAALPDWNISPLDALATALDRAGVASAELSGRQVALTHASGVWHLERREQPGRAAVARAFNEAGLPVLIITRAGSTGISLHASRRFADQRQRVLIEWDAARDPLRRVQFWGRVRRRDQASEPLYETLLLDTPAQRRIQERQSAKAHTLSAHHGLIAAPLPTPWVSVLGESLVSHWARDFPESARRIGVQAPLPGNPVGRVERALARSVVLPPVASAALMSSIEHGIEAGRDLHSGIQVYGQVPSRALRSAWWAGAASAPGTPLSPRLDVVERILPRPPRQAAQTLDTIAAAMAAGQSGQAVLAAWRRAWTRDYVCTQSRQEQAGWAARHLPAMVPGRAIRLTLPGLSERSLAVLLGVVAPARYEDPDAWGLHQVAMEVWPVAAAAPVRVPLSWCAGDRFMAIAATNADRNWFRAPPAPCVVLTMQGDAFAAAAWGSRWGQGEMVVVNDAALGQIDAWMLPCHWTWDKIMTLPRDLADPDHVMACLHENAGIALTAAVPTNAPPVLEYSGREATLSWAAGELDNAKASWLGFSVVRALGRAQAVWSEPRQRKELRHTMSRGALRYILHGLDNAGIAWRLPALYLDWYRRSWNRGTFG